MIPLAPKSKVKVRPLIPRTHKNTTLIGLICSGELAHKEPVEERKGTHLRRTM